MGAGRSGGHRKARGPTEAWPGRKVETDRVREGISEGVPPGQARGSRREVPEHLPGLTTSAFHSLVTKRNKPIVSPSFSLPLDSQHLGM